MPSSIEKLVKNLNKTDFKCMLQPFPLTKVDLLLRKGIFPYDYFDDFEKCSDPHLPPKELFYNQLNEEGITDEE